MTLPPERRASVVAALTNSLAPKTDQATKKGWEEFNEVETAPSGELRLATFDRSFDGTHEELRVTVSEYQGHKFINLRVFFQSKDGQWLPSKKGLGLKKKEIAGLIEALRKGAAVLGVSA